MQKESVRKLISVGIFAIAMGFLEAAVVIYARLIWYPAGFGFPLNLAINAAHYNVELIREIATIVMLLCIGYIAGRKFYERFAYFIFAFAIWDIFYYVFLKIAIGWPASFFTWDLLFLIPWAWVGPVIAPLICSMLLVFLGVLIIWLNDAGKKIKFNLLEWGIFILGVLIVLYTWLIDYGRLLIAGNFTEGVSAYAPSGYSWGMFLIGVLLVLIGICSFWRRTLARR